MRPKRTSSIIPAMAKRRKGPKETPEQEAEIFNQGAALIERLARENPELVADLLESPDDLSARLVQYGVGPGTTDPRGKALQRLIVALSAAPKTKN